MLSSSVSSGAVSLRLVWRCLPPSPSYAVFPRVGPSCVPFLPCRPVLCSLPSASARRPTSPRLTHLLFRRLPLNLNRDDDDGDDDQFPQEGASRRRDRPRPRLVSPFPRLCATEGPPGLHGSGPRPAGQPVQCRLPDEKKLGQKPFVSPSIPGVEVFGRSSPCLPCIGRKEERSRLMSERQRLGLHRGQRLVLSSLTTLCTPSPLFCLPRRARGRFLPPSRVFAGWVRRSGDPAGERRGKDRGLGDRRARAGARRGEVDPSRAF